MFLDELNKLLPKFNEKGNINRMKATISELETDLLASRKSITDLKSNDAYEFDDGENVRKEKVVLKEFAADGIGKIDEIEILNDGPCQDDGKFQTMNSQKRSGVLESEVADEDDDFDYCVPQAPVKMRKIEDDIENKLDDSGIFSP